MAARNEHRNSHLARRLMISLVLFLLPALMAVHASVQTRVIQEMQSSSGKNAAPGGVEKREPERVDGEAKAAASGAASGAPQKFVQEGVSTEFTIGPISKRALQTADLLEGEDYAVTFKIADSRTGTPLTGLHPAAWIDLRDTDKLTGGQDCRQKIQAFLQASFATRPEIDLNTYYLLALNEDATISVIDPLMGYGSSKLLTMVMLKSPGEDWALGRDKKHLFVTMPGTNQVAIVDTSTWKVITALDTGQRPVRLVFQEDQKYLWVGCDAGDSAQGGVTVIDPAVPRVVAFLKTGAGHHEIAFDADDRHAFVTNRLDGTVSVIDVQKLSKIKDLKIGSGPASIAFSNLSKAIYVANDADGSVAVVGGSDLDILTRLTAKPGLRAIRFAPGGRWGFIASAAENAVRIFDAASNQFIQSVAVGKLPDKISFTKDFAYIRCLASGEVSMIELDSIGKSGAKPVLDFPGGQKSPEQASGQSVADSIVQSPEAGSVLVGNPADKMIYYYSEGMAAPMGSFQNYSHEPRAVMVWDRSLRETSPGTYSTTVKLTTDGEYDVAFLLNSPRIVKCFDMSVKPNPDLRKTDERVPFIIQMLIQDSKIRAGEPFTLRFRALDAKTNQPTAGLKDLGVLVFLAPGIWQNRQWAKPGANGVYEISFTPPKAGIYYVFVNCPSLRVQYNQLPHLALEAR